MLKYIAARLAQFALMLLGISLIGFGVMSLTPGMPFAELSLSPQVSEQTLASMQESYGLTAPWWQRCWRWLSAALRGDMGASIMYNLPATTLIWSRAGNTLLLSGVSLLLAWVVALPLSTLAAAKPRSSIDRLINTLCYLTSAMPPFFLALCLLFTVVLFRLPIPIGGATSIDYAWLTPYEKVVDRALHLLIPATALGMSQAAGLLRYMRASLLEVLRQDYIVTARAKGLSRSKVIVRHAWRNAANPVISILGLEIGGLLSGAAITEAVVGWPGLGTLILDAVNARDNNLVICSLLASGALLMLGNLAADILLVLANPRVRCR